MRRFGYRFAQAATTALAVAAVALASGCGSASSPTSPSTPTPQPVVVNTPPVIDDFGLSATRIEAGDTMKANATLHDAETPLDQLKYLWSATPVNGTWTGSGPNAIWQAPGGQKTPDTYTLELTVTENYTSAGQAQANVVSRSGDVHYNDSVQEVANLSNNFFTWFTTFEVTPQQAVSQFSDSCTGKNDELSDITNNRRNFHILGGTWDQLPSISFDRVKQNATATLSCTFYDIPNGGSRETVRGICTLTAIYQNWQWYLCTSHYSGISVTPGSTGNRVSMADTLR